MVSNVANIVTYTDACRNIVNTIMTNEYTSFEKYTSHFIRRGCERVMCERWVGDWTETATYWLPVPPSLAALLSHSAGLLNRGPWGPNPLLRTSSHCRELQQLTLIHWTSCRTGLYHCLTSTCFLWASHLHPIQPVHSQGYTLISSTGCTCSLIDGWVEGQYVTIFPFNINHLFGDCKVVTSIAI